MIDKNNGLITSALLGSIFSIIICLISLIIIDKCVRTDYNTQTIESNINIGDSIKKVNDSLKMEVNDLDSLKDVEIIEIKNLDNDSTVKLFYRLVSE